jgi:hypothetical protein
LAAAPRVIKTAAGLLGFTKALRMQKTLPMASCAGVRYRVVPVATSVPSAGEAAEP